MTVRSILFVLLAVGTAPALSADEASKAKVALIKLVHRPAAQRRGLADELAADAAISLEAWLAAMRDFGDHAPAPAGTHHHEVDLEVLGKTERTLITVFVPERYAPGDARPLLMTFHGSGQDGRGGTANWQSIAETLGMIVVSPTDQRGIGGFTGSKEEHAAAWAALRWARLRYNVDEHAVHATGVSRGGHLLWDLALRRPDRFASITPAIGGPLINMAGGRNNIRYVENLVDVTIRDLQGAKDDPLLVANLRLTFDLLEQAGARDAKLIEFPELGHSFRYDAVDWPKLFGGAHRRQPARVVRRTARKGEGRSHWVEILETRSPVKEIFQLRVNPKTWNTMGPEKQRAYVAQQAEKHTARVEATRAASGHFVVKTKAVKRFRLLLAPSMFVAGERVEVVLNGRSRKLKAKIDKRILLREFAERFDRTFLPVAELVLKP